MKETKEDRDIQLLKFVISVIKEGTDPSQILDRINALLTLRKGEEKK